ncbi:MAG: hypothetical protein KDN18_11695 [Verrucomicrobiae bacterium]|nr:hypothetical protein [Verrucomicrobiae bacterium]
MITLKIHLFSCLLVGILLLGPAARLVDAEEVDVFLFGGQSNMQGIAKITDLPKETPKEIPRAWFWNGKEFESFRIGETRTSNRPGEFGPELGFALEISKTGRSAYLIKYAASGMPLHHGWNGNRWEGGAPQPNRRNFYPGESATDPNQGTLYREMLKRFQTGLEHLKDRGDTPVIRGFLWMQGEQDSKHEESATAYAASLKRLRDRVAEDVGATKTLPMVFGQVLPHEPAMERFTHRPQVREQMASADERSGQPEAIPKVRMVSTDGFGLLNDTVHYDADGQIRLGKAFAEQVEELSGE